MFNTSTLWKSEKISKHVTTFLNLAPVQIHNHAYSLVGSYSERTDNNGPVFKCCILFKIIVKYIKQFCKL
jgi:hypothetical protein